MEIRKSWIAWGFAVAFSGATGTAFFFPETFGQLTASVIKNVSGLSGAAKEVKQYAAEQRKEIDQSLGVIRAENAKMSVVVTDAISQSQKALSEADAAKSELQNLRDEMQRMEARLSRQIEDSKPRFGR